jgi:hypothetical protein
MRRSFLDFGEPKNSALHRFPIGAAEVYKPGRSSQICQPTENTHGNIFFVYGSIFTDFRNTPYKDRWIPVRVK